MTNHPKPTPQLMKPDEVAEILGISTETLTSWRHRGEGPPVIKVTGRIDRYPREQFNAWLESRPVVPRRSNPITAPKPAPTGHPAPKWGTTA